MSAMWLCVYVFLRFIAWFGKSINYLYSKAITKNASIRKKWSKQTTWRSTTIAEKNLLKKSLTTREKFSATTSVSFLSLLCFMPLNNMLARMHARLCLYAWVAAYVWVRVCAGAESLSVGFVSIYMNILWELKYCLMLRNWWLLLFFISPSVVIYFLCFIFILRSIAYRTGSQSVIVIGIDSIIMNIVIIAAATVQQPILFI